jgi:hypothetical protein
MDTFALREFDKRYAHTAVGLNMRGKLVPAIIDRVAFRDDGESTIILSLDNQKLIELEPRKIAVVDFPHRKCFNLDGFVSVFHRRPARQWKKGLCQENSSFVCGSRLLFNKLESTIRENGFRSRMSRSVKPSFETVKALLAPRQVFNFYAFVSSDDFQSCINDEFWVSKTWNDECFAFFRFDIPIGFSINGKIKALCPDFRQELLDLVTRNNLNFEVI